MIALSNLPNLDQPADQPQTRVVIGFVQPVQPLGGISLTCARMRLCVHVSTLMFLLFQVGQVRQVGQSQ